MNTMIKRSWIVLALGIWLLPGCYDDPSYTLEVNAGAHARHQTPVTTGLVEEWRDFPYFSLENLETGNFIPVQRKGEDQLVFLLDLPLEAGATRQYRLRPLLVDPHENHVRVSSSGGRLEVAAKGRPVLAYQEAVAEPPAGSPAHYRKSGFLHPVYTPDSRVITDDFPPDHMHQHGIFFAWPNLQVDGERVDFWNQHKNLGGVTHVETLDTLSGSVFGRLQTRLTHWKYEDADSLPVLNETWKVEVFALGEDHFLYDFQSTLTSVIISDVSVGEYSYGGLGVRLAREWYSDQDTLAPLPEFLTSQGRTRENGNHSRPDWLAASGPVEGTPSGLAVFGHPDNFRYPQPVRIHPGGSMPYFSFAPPVAGAFSIQPGEPYVSRYRFCVFSGENDRQKLESIWQDYVAPPQVKWVLD